MAIVIEFPDHLKPLADACAAVRDQVLGFESSSRGGRPSYRDFEEALAEASAEVERQGHCGALRALDVDAPSVLVDDVLHHRVGRWSGTYFTMVGPVSVERTMYRPAGQRNAKAVDVVGLRAGVVADGWLPRTARAMAHEVQRGPSREAEQSARENLRLPYSRTSFERVAHAVGNELVARLPKIEDALIEDTVLPDNAASLSISLDRTSVPMEEPRRRPRGRPRKGAPKRPVSRVFHMGWAGTVTVHDSQGEALATIRYGRMPHADPSELVAGMLSDAYSLFYQRDGLRLVLLCDGAHELWNLLEPMARELFGADVEITCLVDYWHVAEKLAAAAALLPESAEVRRRWMHALRNRSSAAATILEELQASGKERVTFGTHRPVHEAITYLQNHADRLDYARARRAGLPIGSGNVEATCKSLFEVRMKRSGARWKEDTGEHIVQMRALALSDRWPRAAARVLEDLTHRVRPTRRAS